MDGWQVIISQRIIEKKYHLLINRLLKSEMFSNIIINAIRAFIFTDFNIARYKTRAIFDKDPKFGDGGQSVYYKL